MRRLAALALPLVAAAVLSATPADARSGAVFVHGAGSNFLNDTAGARAYWGEDMLRASTRNWTVPYLVAHYDSNQYMWVGAGQVAGQIHDWMMANGIDDIVVNTHSFGGTVLRWIMSNPGYDARYPAIIARIRWVNSIAGPHKGSEAANLAGTLSGSWLTGWMVSLVGANTDAHKNCRTDWMAYYNQYYLKGTSGRPALPRSVYTIAGTGLWNDFVHSEDYGLATLSGIAGLPGEDDGMVAQYSAQGVGLIWFSTAANHHHNRRNDYRKIGDSLGSDFALTLAGGGGKEAVAVGGTGAYAPPRETAPAQVSRAFVRTVALRDGRATIDLPVEGTGELLVWTIAVSDAESGRAVPAAVRSALYGPSGAPVAGEARHFPIEEALPGLALTGSQEALHVAAPGAGVYRLEVEGAAAGRAAVTVVAAQPASPLKLTSWTGPLSRQPGQPVTVYAALAEGGDARAGATVSARLAPPAGTAGRPFLLHDDGRHGDGAAGDGLYAARVNPAGAPGLWTVRVEAQGTDGSGLAFARTGSSGFVSEPGGARLRGGTLAARVVEAQGERRLRVAVAADVARAGRYRLDVIVAGAAGGDGTRATLAADEKVIRLGRGGAQLTAEVPLAGDETPALVDVRLLGLDEPGL
ncbi:MAG TPA: choice-of-anchor X domain-containing protein, partial [Vicinamibacteria bacterium]|nr:choice-of-anchor X domain-containing protein [Vicinamibacteria bacterium]